MKLSVGKYWLLLVAGIVGWLPAYTAGFADVRARYQFPPVSAKALAIDDRMPSMRVEGKRRTKGRCAECGLIVSMREIAGSHADFQRAGTGGMTAEHLIEAPLKASRRYEITLRMADGSIRVISHDRPASWRAGERAILIEGANGPNGPRERKAQTWIK